MLTDDQRIQLLAAALHGLNANAAFWTGAAAVGHNAEEVCEKAAELAVAQVDEIERRFEERPDA